MATSTRPWSVKGIGEPVRDIARRRAKATGMPIGRWIDQAIQNRLTAPAEEAPAALDHLAAKVAASERNIEAAFVPLLRDLHDLAARVVAAEQALAPRDPAVLPQAAWPRETLPEDTGPEDAGPALGAAAAPARPAGWDLPPVGGDRKPLGQLNSAPAGALPVRGRRYVVGVVRRRSPRPPISRSIFPVCGRQPRRPAI